MRSPWLKPSVRRSGWRPYRGRASSSARAWAVSAAMPCNVRNRRCFSRAVRRGANRAHRPDAHACQRLARLRSGVDAVHAGCRRPGRKQTAQHAQRGGLALPLGPSRPVMRPLGACRSHALHRLHQLGRLAPKQRVGWPENSFANTLDVDHGASPWQCGAERKTAGARRWRTAHPAAAPGIGRSMKTGHHLAHAAQLHDARDQPGDHDMLGLGLGAQPPVRHGGCGGSAPLPLSKTWRGRGPIQVEGRRVHGGK